MHRFLGAPAPSPGVRRAWARLAVAAIAGAAFVLPAAAQEFPSRPVRLIVNTAPGGIADTVYRAAAEPMGKFLGQPVVVESRAGGSGTIGTAALVKSPPDGHVLGMTSDSTLVMLPLLRRNLPYDAEKDLSPIAPMATIPVGLVVPASLPVNSVREFVAHVRANPGKLNYASIGPGSSYHLAAEMFLAQEKLSMVHVPYAGGSQILTSLIRGDASATFAGVATFIEHAKAGRLRILAVSGDRRMPALPDVPTFREAGLGQYRAGTHVGVAVPRATPSAIQKRLLDAVHAALDDPVFQRTVVAHGMVVPERGSQAAYAEELAAERVRWAALIARLNIPIE